MPVQSSSPHHRARAHRWARTSILVCSVLLVLAVPGMGATGGASDLLDIPLDVYGQGTRTSLAAWQGHLVLVNFWAPWCVPCRQEFPELEELAHRPEHRGLAVVGVTAEPDTAQIANFLRRIRVSFPILLDREARLHEAIGLAVMPTTVLLDRQGHVAQVYQGYSADLGLARMEADLEQLEAKR